MKHHYGWIIILLGALVVCATSCGDSKPSVTVKCWTLDDGENYYTIKVTSKSPYKYETVREYYDISNITNAWFIKDKAFAVNLAKHFDTWEKFNSWDDSVKSLVKPTPEPLSKSILPNCDETITIY